ncbi:PorP/SprF family type IX secretion system membrane protein [Plebeiibacterium sediminum]|uniref:Type IX secretion system membrane protein PorP/SprF n=1 Tax=Plebeiibacterium sediminum TaxID=2992112 RepID=A0AAE3MAL5_9BACT|nr:type IX secretion system membrane protein PorP/SprF [Plebeiobacterium sediminum]MCW3789505.1 type IX secretion system membrane protein PorP/SprF [Plebeiobacterium sediminum]
MKKVSVLSILFLICILAGAQKYYITNLYMYDMFLLNPASAGSNENCYSFSAFYQNQWMGMDESPTTQILNFQTPLKDNLGMGSYVYNDRNGNMKEFGLHQAFSYEILLAKKRRSISTISFGLSFDIEQSKIDESSLVDHPSALGDQAITGGITAGWGYNSSTGILYKYNDYQLGFAVTNLFNQNNPLYLNYDEPDLARDYNISLSSMYKISSLGIFVEPIIMYRQNSNKDRKLDLTLKGIFPTMDPEYALWGLVSYRRTMDYDYGKSLGLGTTIGVNYHRISFGVEWQLGLTGAQQDLGSAYQLVLKYVICNNLKKKAIPCSEVQKFKNARYSGISW